MVVLEEKFSSKALENLETALQQCKGSQSKAALINQRRQAEQLSHIQQFTRYLIFEKLGAGGKSQLDKVAELIERLPWHDEEEFISRTLVQQITNFSKFNDVSNLLF